jgi:hypothetical protein
MKKGMGKRSKYDGRKKEEKLRKIKVKRVK